jgi:hypothetical protein
LRRLLHITLPIIIKQKIVNIISQRIERKYNGCNLEGRAYCKVNGNGPQRAPRPSVTEQDTRTLLIRVPQAQDSKKAKARRCAHRRFFIRQSLWHVSDFKGIDSHVAWSIWLIFLQRLYRMLWLRGPQVADVSITSADREENSWLAR